MFIWNTNEEVERNYLKLKFQIYHL